MRFRHIPDWNGRRLDLLRNALPHSVHARRPRVGRTSGTRPPVSSRRGSHRSTPMRPLRWAPDPPPSAAAALGTPGSPLLLSAFGFRTSRADSNAHKPRAGASGPQGAPRVSPLCGTHHGIEPQASRQPSEWMEGAGGRRVPDGSSASETFGSGLILRTVRNRPVPFPGMESNCPTAFHVRTRCLLRSLRTPDAQVGGVICRGRLLLDIFRARPLQASVRTSGFCMWAYVRESKCARHASSRRRHLSDMLPRSSGTALSSSIHKADTTLRRPPFAGQKKTLPYHEHQD
jgi:hypothetical protein